MALGTDIQQQVFDLLSRASNISFVTADQEGGGVSLLEPGQRVSAEVLSTLPNNRVQVRVGVERFNLDLPMAVRVGQSLEMTFVSADPRSTFAVARQAGITPPVSLSDASRLLSLLVSDEQGTDTRFRTSLQSVGDMLRRSSGEAAVLANLLDEAITYGAKGGAAVSPAAAGRLPPEQARLANFESNAAQILKNIAQSSRFTMIEAANQPLTPLPLLPGEEVDATITGVLPGGRAFVQVAGTSLELLLTQKVVPGEIMRLTYLSAEPKPTFALARAVAGGIPPLLSEAGRWLSVLEHSVGGVSTQQAYVLERLNSVLKSLPSDSPAFSVISDEALTYDRSLRTSSQSDSSAVIAAQAAVQNPAGAGNGIVLSDDMAKLLQAVIKGNRLALLEALNQQALPAGFAPGQQLRGEVLAALGGGRFSVQVGAQMLEFMMPKGIRRGDRVNLFFITEEPQLTFLMARFGRPGDSKVSDTGRWLSSFLGEAAGQMPAQSALGILQTLLAGPATDATLLSRMLQQGLRESGLFYESHLASWFGGDYKLDDLLREPQGRLSPRLPQSGSPVDEFVLGNTRAGAVEIMEALFKKAGSSMAHEGIADQRSLALVGEQLSALQSGQLLLRGNLFPGQPMEWTVTEREAQRDESGGRGRNWETSVTLTLPRLGAVTAKLSLDGTRVAVKVSAENDTTVPVLEEGRTRLVEQLEGAGLTPAEMSIRHVTG
ncbi:MAG: flagellar hook-length control protein FliK [Desulfuromonadaceae bacterium]|nr:flagellar hook-length control protein FliK [Desulfuromonadaceae bacterium]MDD2847138.1 flagellar hook-length control protein FliK [Desulfuromonadaceae bacterium]MDD4130082.1 flagellar hook-length control protein FliK [Desulfuromonadaceae bacterium]